MGDPSRSPGPSAPAFTLGCPGTEKLTPRRSWSPETGASTAPAGPRRARDPPPSRGPRLPPGDPAFLPGIPPPSRGPRLPPGDPTSVPGSQPSSRRSRLRPGDPRLPPGDPTSIPETPPSSWRSRLPPGDPTSVPGIQPSSWRSHLRPGDPASLPGTPASVPGTPPPSRGPHLRPGDPAFLLKIPAFLPGIPPPSRGSSLPPGDPTSVRETPPPSRGPPPPSRGPHLRLRDPASLLEIPPSSRGSHLRPGDPAFLLETPPPSRGGAGRGGFCGAEAGAALVPWAPRVALSLCAGPRGELPIAGRGCPGGGGAAKPEAVCLGGRFPGGWAVPAEGPPWPGSRGPGPVPALGRGGCQLFLPRGWAISAKAILAPQCKKSNSKSPVNRNPGEQVPEGQGHSRLRPGLGCGAPIPGRRGVPTRDQGLLTLTSAGPKRGASSCHGPGRVDIRSSETH
uniref:basic proline-rich protein-like n=1 Tax=Jaculus jaculus TaxID=51337 RepID=UPI001E1B415F|nr:basic proline-rich protein-like [Jaculus jaculus]